MRATIAFLIAAGFMTLPAFGQAKKRVAVFNFDYATVQNDIQAIFGANQDVGKGVADLLVNKLVSSGAYSVVERKALDKILAEQNFSNSDRADATSAAKIGRLLGADAIIVGSITQFGRDDKTTNVGGGAFGGIGRKYGIGGVGQKSSKAAVGLTARLVNVDTAEIMAVAQGSGQSSRSGTSLTGAGGSIAGEAIGALDMTSSNFANTILGEAVNQAVNSLGGALDREAGRLPTKVIAIDGLIADVSGDGVVINVGSRSGLKVGDRLKVMRTGRAITDPATGKVLRRQEQELGDLVITDVDEASAGGKFTGSGAPKVGDRVKNP